MIARTFNPYQISRRVLLFLFVLGVGSLTFYLWHGYALRQARLWPKTEATVTSCHVTSFTNLSQDQFGSYFVRADELKFAFSYRVSGREYVSRRFYVLGHPPASAVAHDFPVGRRFLASYNVASPDGAVVEPGPAYDVALLAAVICLGMTGAGVIYNRCQR